MVLECQQESRRSFAQSLLSLSNQRCTFYYPEEKFLPECGRIGCQPCYCTGCRYLVCCLALQLQRILCDTIPPQRKIDWSCLWTFCLCSLRLPYFYFPRINIASSSASVTWNQVGRPWLHWSARRSISRRMAFILGSCARRTGRRRQQLAALSLNAPPV